MPCSNRGAPGDDWIAVAQSICACLRFSLVGGVIEKQIQNMGYSAKPHTVMDGNALQPPVLLLSGLGEASRIVEMILNPDLGPRLKSGTITTDLELIHGKPIDFGLSKAQQENSIILCQSRAAKPESLHIKIKGN